MKLNYFIVIFLELNNCSTYEGLKIRELRHGSLCWSYAYGKKMKMEDSRSRRQKSRELLVPKDLVAWELGPP